MANRCDLEDCGRDLPDALMYQVFRYGSQLLWKGMGRIISRRAAAIGLLRGR